MSLAIADHCTSYQVTALHQAFEADLCCLVHQSLNKPDIRVSPDLSTTMGNYSSNKIHIHTSMKKKKTIKKEMQEKSCVPVVIKQDTMLVWDEEAMLFIYNCKL